MCATMSLARLVTSFSCHQLASSTQHVPSGLHCTSAPKRAVSTKPHRADVSASCSSNGTVDLYSVNGGTPLYDDIQPDDFARPKRSSSAVNSAVYECVRIHTDGRMATVYLKRRDLLRLFALDPRDLRCIDPNLHYTRLSPCLYVRGNVILAQLAGVRLIITANTALLLDPHSSSARKLLGQLIPKLQVVAGQRLMAGSIRSQDREENSVPEISFPDDLPFELDVLEAALNISISKLDGELLHTQDLVQTCLHRLPRDITPGNLDELRKAKSALLELESKSEAFREVLEGMMDDEDELKDFNLSSRVVREERRRQRERSRLERELERERTLRDSGASGNSTSSMSSRDREFTHDSPTTSNNPSSSFDSNGAAPSHPRDSEWREGQRSRSGRNSQSQLAMESASTILNRIEASQSYAGDESSDEMETVAMQELRAMFDQEEEEQDLQEVEDLFEFYLQRATSIQTESERMLASARDLEESIGLTLSARRFEVQRLELRLSIGSFAAAIGAVVAGIFGMNLRSTLEDSILGFWGTTALIIMGCVGIYLYVLQWTRRKKILG